MARGTRLGPLGANGFHSGLSSEPHGHHLLQEFSWACLQKITPAGIVDLWPSLTKTRKERWVMETSPKYQDTSFNHLFAIMP